MPRQTLSTYTSTQYNIRINTQKFTPINHVLKIRIKQSTRYNIFNLYTLATALMTHIYENGRSVFSVKGRSKTAHEYYSNRNLMECDVVFI